METDAFSLEWSYDRYPRIETAFDELLDVSLEPRGPEVLYDLVAELGLPADSVLLDLGCGEGRHALNLSKRFGFQVHGIDPVPRHIELSNEALAAADDATPGLRSRVRFGLGRAEAIPLDDKTIHLVWCRDVLVHVAHLHKAYTEIRRVLRDQGVGLIYQMFWGDRLEPGEATWLWRVLGNAVESAKPEATERAIETAGLTIRKRIELGSDWGEWAQETSGLPGRRLLHAARLLRDPDRYVQAYGRSAYDLKLADSLWHVYRMIGKLSPRIYVITPKATGE